MIQTSEPTADRVMEHTPPEVNQQIEMQMRQRVRELIGRLDAIDERLKRIEKEWDIERTLEANAAALSLLGLLLGRKWRRIGYLPIVVAAFLLQHAVQGWCPPVSIFRRMGVRTMKEIDRERYALKALRGDFKNIKPDGDPQQQTLAALNAADYRGRG